MANTNRCVLEVLKWVDPRSVLKATSQVSVLWNAASNSERLWRKFCLFAAIRIEELSEKAVPAKQRYRAIVLERKNQLCFVARNSTMRLYLCGQKTSAKEITFPSIEFNPDAIVAVISYKEVFFSRRGNHKSSPFILDLQSQAVTDLPSLLQDLTHSSAVYLNDSIYIFGGCMLMSLNKALPCAERLSLAEANSVRLPNMRSPRCKFSACSRGALIYLCGGNSRSSETFNSVSEEYKDLGFQLETIGWTVSCFHEGELICICRSELYRIRENSIVEKKAFCEEIVKEAAYWKGNMRPVMCGYKVFISMPNCDKFIEVNLKTLKFRRFRVS